MLLIFIFFVYFTFNLNISFKCGAFVLTQHLFQEIKGQSRVLKLYVKFHILFFLLAFLMFSLSLSSVCLLPLHIAFVLLEYKLCVPLRQSRYLDFAMYQRIYVNAEPILTPIKSCTRSQANIQHVVMIRFSFVLFEALHANYIIIFIFCECVGKKLAFLF